MSNKAILSDNAKKQSFIDYLFGVADGDPEKAKTLAGYPSNLPLRAILRSLSAEVIKEVEAYMAICAYKAFMALNKVMDDPNQLGANHLLNVANSVLDRAGIVKKDKLEIETNLPTALLILPPKDTN